MCLRAFSQDPSSLKIKIPIISPELAEDIGIQIGDGSISYYEDNYGKLRRRYRIEVSGNITEDVDYITNVVKPIKERLFGNIRSIIYKNTSAGTIYLRINSKNLFYFYKFLGLPINSKYDIKIPKFILKDKKLKIACIRGLFDTDGSLTFTTLENYIYPRIRFATKSKKLALQICKILKELDITYSVMYDNRRQDKRTKSVYTINDIYISGKPNLEKWMNNIGFHNKVHISRYFIYKNLGSNPSHTTLNQRLKIIKNGGAGVI